MIIEEAGLRVMTDPGIYSTEQNNAKNIDVVLITHEHGDHLHMESLKTVLANNPKAKVITNNAVGKILAKENISFEILEHGQSKQVGNLTLEGHGEKHAEIFEEYGQVQNTGFFIGGKLFYPGDALYNPGKAVEVLAFPTAGSWANIKQSIDYVFEIAPKKCFPVHDGAFKTTKSMYSTYNTLIPPKGIRLILPEHGSEFEA